MDIKENRIISLDANEVKIIIAHYMRSKGCKCSVSDVHIKIGTEKRNIGNWKYDSAPMFLGCDVRVTK